MTTQPVLTKTSAIPVTTIASTARTATTFHQLRAPLMPFNINGCFVASTAFVVAIILAITTSTVHAKSPDEATLLQIRTDCRQQTKPPLSNSEYKIITEHKLLNAETTTATTPKSLQCFCLCYLNAAGAFKNNQPNSEYLRNELPALVKDVKKATALAGKCGQTPKGGGDNCEKAFNFVHCMAKEGNIYLY